MISLLHYLLQGLVDISKCQEKIHQKIKSAEEKLKILLNEMTKPSYDKVSKISTNIRGTHTIRLFLSVLAKEDESNCFCCCHNAYMEK